ncbi:MAG: hypothetical protein IJD10_01880, partial [Clostridia bacterium]|nr:hypothetical protein [Clostridia bacterium]
NDTLVQRVMKKVEELKLWQLKNEKSGFAEVYKDVLGEVETLPESVNKYHALADVLIRGWWWLPGEKNNALLGRIREAALLGKNEEVMAYISTRERARIYGDAKMEFMRDKQIPFLEKHGFRSALGSEWFWLGYFYLDKGETDKGLDALDHAEALFRPSEAYYSLIPTVRAIEAAKKAKYGEKDEKRYRLIGAAYELRRVDGNIRFFNVESYDAGDLWSIQHHAFYPIKTACLCDGYFFRNDLSVGESYVGSDNSLLTHVSDDERVETPCGVFEGCQLWETVYLDDHHGKTRVRCYYREGVGIVRLDWKAVGIRDSRVLKHYDVKGGEGLLPLAEGNRWEYADEYREGILTSSLSVEVAYAEKGSVILSTSQSIERMAYDETSWVDTMIQIKNEYYSSEENNYKLVDISDVIDRAERLAQTPMEKAHTKAAASVMRRILATDMRLNPNAEEKGLWNFYTVSPVRRKGLMKTIHHSYDWHFEWKGDCRGAGKALLYNDPYEQMTMVCDGLWSEEWRVGWEEEKDFCPLYEMPIHTRIRCVDGGTVTTKAGAFENCLTVCIDSEGFAEYVSYFGGRKEYTFAPGVGLVRAVNFINSGSVTAVYELTAYEGVGDGYMPAEDGMMRRYEGQNFSDGYFGAAEYTYVADEDGDVLIFTDRTGVQRKLPPVSSYSSIQDEVKEDELWEQGNGPEARLTHDINNFRILYHFFSRPSRSLAAPERAAAFQRLKLRMIEDLEVDGELPRAWWGYYWKQNFFMACYLFGCEREDLKEEGYAYLEKAFALYPRWRDIPDGELLELGDELIFGGVRYEKGKNHLLLPDGRTVLDDVFYFFCPQMEGCLYGMTAPRGWEWFNPVRNEERFKVYIEKAKTLMDTEKSK